MKIKYFRPGAFKTLRLAFIVALVMAAMSVSWDHLENSPSRAAAELAGHCPPESGTCLEESDVTYDDVYRDDGGARGSGGCAMGGGNYQQESYYEEAQDDVPEVIPPTVEEQRRDKRDDAWSVANDYWYEKDWLSATQAYEKAYAYCVEPLSDEDRINCETLLQNLAATRAFGAEEAGDWYFNQGDWANAVMAYENGLKFCRDSNEDCDYLNDMLARALHKRKFQRLLAYQREANEYEDFGDWAQAVIAWSNAFELCEQEENCEIIRNRLRDAEATSLRDEAVALQDNDDWERAVEIWEDALQHCKWSEYCDDQLFTDALLNARNRRDDDPNIVDWKDALAESEAGPDEESSEQEYIEDQNEIYAKAANENSRQMLYAGRWEQAEQYLREYLRYKPGDASTHSRLGYALLKQGRYAEAVEVNRQAVKQAKGKNDFTGFGDLDEAALRDGLVLSLDSYAWTLAVNGGVSQARALYSEAVDAAQGNLQLQSKLEGLLKETYLAAASLPNGAEVREMATRALVRLDPASVYNQVLLGETLFINGDAAGAKAAYLAAVRLKPGDRELIAHIAKRLVDFGDPQAASDLMTKAIQTEAKEATDSGADIPFAVFEADAPNAIGQACGVAGLSSSDCPVFFKLKGMDVQTRFMRQVKSIPQAARTPEIAAIIEEGQVIVQRIDSNEQRLNEVHLLIEQNIIVADPAEISRIENEIKTDEVELKKTEKKLTSFSLLAKIKQLEAGQKKDKDPAQGGESNNPSATVEPPISGGETAAADN